MPPTNAITMLVRLPMTQAAIGRDEQGEEIERIQLREQGGDQHAGQAGQHARQDPREERHPLGVDALNCRRRGLSTTARMRRPIPPRRNMMARETTTIAVRLSVAIWPTSSTKRLPCGQRKSSVPLHPPERRRVLLGVAAEDQPDDLGHGDQQAE